MGRTNGLALNTKKTRAIVFGSSHALKVFRDLEIPTISVNSNGDNVPLVDKVTSLEAILDSTQNHHYQNQHQALYLTVTTQTPH